MPRRPPGRGTGIEFADPMQAALVPFPATPAVPALVVGARGACWLEADGTVRALAPAAAAAEAGLRPPLVVHAPAVRARLGLERLVAYDVLELYAFVRPARFCLPTPRGLAEALELPAPADQAGEARTLRLAAGALLRELALSRGAQGPEVAALARTMARGGWIWADGVLTALGIAADPVPGSGTGLDVWNRLPEWSDSGGESPPGSQPVEPAESRRRLAELLGPAAEARPSQGDYASAVTAAFQPREREDCPNVVLAEAGTGVGKTLGYVAPASLWAERNAGPVWISTFTRNLQRQIDAELDRLFPDPEEKRRKVVIRKGRENYLCLLNFEEAAGRVPTAPESAVGLGLLARWALASRDGDLAGGDLPAWLAELIGRARVQRLADQRGECIYSACPHYRTCFVERTIRRARRAEIVVANHALVLAQAAAGGLDDNTRPVRYVFDEGHHLFDAADSAFAAYLSGQETTELRRWLLGADGRRGSRARGLERRIGDLLDDDPQAQQALRQLLGAARQLPSTGWTTRLEDGTALGPAEEFLALLRQQVLARSTDEESAWRSECAPLPPVDGLLDAAAALIGALESMLHPVALLRRALAGLLDRKAATLETATRQRIESLNRSLLHRAELPLRAWRDMLVALEEEPPADFVDWFAIDRIEGREVDVGYYRHWRDPSLPFANAVLKPSHGAVITSASLRDTTGTDAEAGERDWRGAEQRTGAAHLLLPAMRAAVPSPFDYASQTRAFVVTDVGREQLDQVAAAYRELFLAAGGGGLGLFTAIHRLRGVHRRIAGPLEAAGLPLYAQHVDGMDTATLVDIFRAEDDACLLGTDAVRDGVDVPGRSLRLIVFDRVPWPRPDILHKARKAHFRRTGPDGKLPPASAYDDMLTRFRLKQAFGRLVRRADDHGVFVMLDARTPSRLLTALPPGVNVERVGLKEAVERTRAFLASRDLAGARIP